jgi:hypothetical protein
LQGATYAEKDDSLLTAILVFAVLVSAAFMVWMYQSMKRDRDADKREGVVASWHGLRVTPTELIENYTVNAQRHQLAGLTARVEDSGTNVAPKRNADDARQVFVIVEGPATGIVRTAPASSAADSTARHFVVKLNMLSKQALG